MIGAVAEQTLTNPLSAEQMLLNGIAICFIMDFDMLLWLYVMPQVGAQ